MQKFWWPGYEAQLLEQLQRQQNSTQFCDTLLQTEGISVPAHSCVLAALSPYLSQRLSAAPSPPSGQKRRLPLQAVTARTLLKLVGLLYSGELEVKGGEEQGDVLAAAHRFGLADLVIGCGDGGRKGVERPDRRQRVHARDVTTRDAQVQAEMGGRSDGGRLVRRKSLASVGTQTASGSVTSAAGPGPPSDQTTPPPGGASSAASFSSTPPQNVTQLSLSPYPAVRSDPESAAEPSPSSSASSGCAAPVPAPIPAPVPAPLSGAGSPGSHRTNVSRPSSESGRSISHRDRPGRVDGDVKATVDGATSDQLRGAGRGSMLGKEEEEEEEKSWHLRRSGKNLEKMKQTYQMMGTEPVSVKVKLRRRTKGELWEIVDGQHGDETVAVPTSLKQSRWDQKTPQTGLGVVQNLPGYQTVQPDFTSSPRPPAHAQPGSYSETSSNGCLSTYQSNELECESLPSPRSPLEESDEQIEKLLEDIMMSLNILPDPDRNREKAPMNHGAVAACCQVEGTGSGAGSAPPHAAVGAAGCVFYQDLETQRGLSPKHSGFQYSFGAQNRPSYVAPSSLQTDFLIQQQQRSEFSSPIQPFRPGEENSPYPRAAGPILPDSCLYGRKKLRYTVSQQQSPHGDENVEFLALEHGSESESAGALHLPFVDASRLPRCLSPLEPGPHAAPPQPEPSASVRPRGYVRPSLQAPTRPPKTACTQQLPLNATAASKSTSRLLEAKLPAKTGREAGHAKRGTKSQPKWKPDPKKRKKSTHGAAEDARPPKWRKLPESGKGSEGLVLDSTSAEVRDAASSPSSPRSDVPIKERKETTCSPTKPHAATISTATGSEKSNAAASQTRIRTRSFVKKYQLNDINTISDNCCVLIPVLRRPVAAQKHDPAAPKRKRGRPRKIKLEETLPERASANAEDESHKKEEKAEEKIPTGRELLSGARDGEAGQLEKTTSAEHSGKNAKSRSWMVTLKEFQKFIKQKHSNTRKGTAVQDANVEGPRKAEAWEAAEEAEKSDGATLDENHNLLPSASPSNLGRLEATGSSGTSEMVASAHGDRPASEGDGAMLSSQRAQPATGPDQGPPLSGADGSSIHSGCDEEADDEVEVDVMLYSPGKGSSTRAPEERVVVLPDEEEEEESNEIDVTGDEEE